MEPRVYHHLHLPSTPVSPNWSSSSGLPTHCYGISIYLIPCEYYIPAYLKFLDLITLTILSEEYNLRFSLECNLSILSFYLISSRSIIVFIIIITIIIILIRKC
jgi:hypothetical protein